MFRSRLVLFLALGLMAISGAACEKVNTASEVDILAVMQAAQDGWNAGDLESYMQCYHQSPELRFAGGDEVSYGWEPVLKKYQAGYPDRAAMGQLKFSDMDVQILGQDNALVFGRWLLKRSEDQPHGLFTLHFQRTGAGWKIMSDHTSSGDPERSAAVATITSADLMEKVEQLSGQEFGGRLPGSDGYNLAAQAMADRFRELGLTPGGDDGFFQKLPMEYNQVLPGCRFALENSRHQFIEAELDQDYLFRGFTGSGDLEASVVFCGYGLSLPERGYDDYADTDVDGKVVLVFKQAPPWKLAGENLYRLTHPRIKAQTALDHGAVAVLVVSRPNDRRPQPLINSVMHGDGDQVDIPQLQISHEIANELLSHTGLSLSEFQSRIDESQAPYSRELNQSVQVKVETTYLEKAETMNVVAILPGSDAELKDECLVIGAHLDHVGTQGGTAFFPGPTTMPPGRLLLWKWRKPLSREMSSPNAVWSLSCSPAKSRVW